MVYVALDGIDKTVGCLATVRTTNTRGCRTGTNCCQNTSHVTINQMSYFLCDCTFSIIVPIVLPPYHTR